MPAPTIYEIEDEYPSLAARIRHWVHLAARALQVTEPEGINLRSFTFASEGARLSVMVMDSGPFSVTAHRAPDVPEELFGEWYGDDADQRDFRVFVGEVEVTFIDTCREE